MPPTPELTKEMFDVIEDFTIAKNKAIHDLSKVYAEMNNQPNLANVINEEYIAMARAVLEPESFKKEYEWHFNGVGMMPVKKQKKKWWIR